MLPNMPALLGARVVSVGRHPPPLLLAVSRRWLSGGGERAHNGRILRRLRVAGRRQLACGRARARDVSSGDERRWHRVSWRLVTRRR